MKIFLINFIMSLVILIIITNCEDSVEIDTTPPVVSIQSPLSGTKVSEIVKIVVSANDNKGIEKVEFFIDDSLYYSDFQEPYEYCWNTCLYDDNSEHNVKVKAYDESENFTISQPILLIVDNSKSYPSPVNIISVTYTYDKMIATWEKSLDNDFKEYKLLYLQQEHGQKDTLITYTDKSIISHVITEFDPTHENWFWILVSDTLGLSTVGNGMSNNIEPPPNQSQIYPISYENSCFHISWTKTNDDDFDSYKLYESYSPEMSGKTEIYTTDNNTETSYIITDIAESEIRYYQIVTKDFWGLQSFSNIQKGSSYITFLTILGGGIIGGDGGGESVLQTNDRGYIITGGCYKWLIKTNVHGEEEWSQNFTNPRHAYGYSVKETIDGGYIISGKTFSDETNEDVWLIKTDSYGNEEWTKIFGDIDNNVGYSIDITFDGGYIITGYTMVSGNWIGKDIYLIKTDASGNEEWNKKFDGDDHGDDIGYSIQQTIDGGYIILGSTKISPENRENIWLLKTNSNGSLQWKKTFGGADYDVGYSIQQTTDNGYILTGYTTSWGKARDVILIKTDANGNDEWSRTYGGSQDDEGYSVQQTSDSGFVITGLTKSYGSNLFDYHVWLIKTDSNGNEEWSNTFCGNNIQIGFSLKQTIDGGYIITGGKSIWLIKTDSEGEVIQ